MKFDGSFGDWLKQRRKALDLTQLELADQVGCAVATIRKIEQHIARPSKQIAERLVEVLVISDEERPGFLTFARRWTAHNGVSLPIGTSVPSHHLPIPTMPFIGREMELAQLAERLNDPTCRLLTILGPGGIGKTRLALEAARQQIKAFANGACFVSLAGLDSSSFIVSTTAEAIGLAVEPSLDITTQLTNYLSDKNMLLLLDNFDHLLDGVGLITTLLQNAPDVRILATSRERLHLQEEWLFPLQGLAIPDQTSDNSGVDAQDYSAVQLFAQTARRVDPTFSVSAQSAVVVNICQLVEGMPLAIELAAGSLQMMSGEEIARRIAADLSFLNTSLRDVPERHRSIRAVFDQSWRLLSENERAALGKLSVFRGGFNLEAANEVAGASVDLVAALVEKSLVRRYGDVRYDLHELVRQYAAQKLREAGEADRTCQRELDYFLCLVERAEPEMSGPAQLEWFSRFDEELDNIRGVLSWSVENNVEDGLKMATQLYPYWTIHATEMDGIDWLRRLLARPEASTRNAPRAWGLVISGFLLGMTSGSNETKLRAQEGLSIFRDLGDEEGIAAALHALGLGYSCRHRNDPEAYPFLLESLALYRKIGNKILMARLLNFLGNALMSADFQQAHAYLEEALTLCRERGDIVGIQQQLCLLARLDWFEGNLVSAQTRLAESAKLGSMLGFPRLVSGIPYELGELALSQGNYGQAQYYFEDYLSQCNQVVDAVMTLWVRSKLAYLALRQGDMPRSYVLLLDCLERFQEDGNEMGMTYCVEGLASLAVLQGQYEFAVRLFARSDATREVVRNTRPVPEQADVDRDLGTIREHLDEMTFTEAYEQGRAITLEKVVAQVLRERGR